MSNGTVKRVRALRSRKGRDTAASFFVEGIRIVAEAVKTSANLQLLVTAPDLLSSDYAREIVESVQLSGVACLEVTPAVFESLSGKDNPTGIGAVIQQHWEVLDDLEMAGASCLIALDSVADPGNLGTILRTSDAVGGVGVVLLDGSTDPYDPAALRASMGAVFSQKLLQASWEEFCAWRCDRGHQLVGTSDSAHLDYSSVAYATPTILLMGSERQGLSKDKLESCDLVVHIPMAGRSDSLNLAVATSIVLYEMFNQRRYGLDSATTRLPTRH